MTFGARAMQEVYEPALKQYKVVQHELTIAENAVHEVQDHSVYIDLPHPEAISWA